MNKRKIIIAGFGFMGQTHAYNILHHPDWELTAIVDIVSPVEQLKRCSGNVATNRPTAEIIENIPYFTTLEQALKALAADAVLVATPTVCHYELGCQALKNNCDLFLEKPMCLRLEQCRHLLDTAKAQKRILMVGHCLRFVSEYRLLEEVIRDKRYGELSYLKLSRYAGMPGWWRNGNADTETGGAVFDLIIHDIDFARALFGSPDEIMVQPLLREKFHPNIVDSVWKYANGPVVQIDGAFMPEPHTPFHGSYTAVFEHGTLQFDSNCVKLIDSRGANEIPLNPTDQYAAEFNYFSECVTHNRWLEICNGDEAMNTIAECLRY